MKHWTGNIVYKHDWTVHSENPKHTPITIYDWEARETQTWKLNDPPTADIADPPAYIYDATWTITGSGNENQEQGQSQWTKDWTINGSNSWPIKIRIKELSDYIWRVAPTANGGNGIHVIDMNQTVPGSKPSNSKLNWHERNIPIIAVEKSAHIIAKLTGGKPGVVTGPSGYRPWSLLSESLRSSLSGWIMHETPLSSTDIASRGVMDPRVGQKFDPSSDWISTITGTCTWSWRLEEIQ